VASDKRGSGLGCVPRTNALTVTRECAFRPLKCQPGVDVHLHTYVRAGVTVAEAQNVVLFQHGLGEHGGRYCEMAERLFSRAPALDALLTYDIRGHGMTAKGIYCKVASVGELAADFDKVLDHWLAVCSPTARFVVAGRALPCAPFRPARRCLQ
jgi:pimeloyl-ACP methyl ester carboxylesterase